MENTQVTPVVATSIQQQGVRVGPAILLSLVVFYLVTIESNLNYGIVAGNITFALVLISLQLQKITQILIEIKNKK